MKPVDRIIECDLQIQDVEVMVLEDNVRDVRRQLVQAFSQNDKLVTALSEAREQMGLAEGGGRQALCASLHVRDLPLRQ